MVAVTSTGLRADNTPVSSLPPVPWAIAAGTADAIIATYTADPITGLTDGLIVSFRAASANATATPTFAPDGFTAHTITREGGSPLKAGDIAGAGAEYLLRYKLASTRWELLNPSRDSGQGHVQWVAATGIDTIEATYAPAVLSLTDGLILGFRAASANATTTPTFSPNGLAAKTIVKNGGVALVVGDIPAANADMLIRYDLANTRWELLNPKYNMTGAEAHTLWFSGNGELFRVLDSDAAGADSSSAQPWFPATGSVTVEASKTYLFEGLLHLTRAAGSTSHTTGVLFGGTATLTSIRYLAQCKEGDANDLQDISGFIGAAATELVVKAASTSTTENVIIRVQGMIRINGAGTLIPQFKYSAAPGGAPTVKANSFFRMIPLGTNTVTAKGTWA